MRLTDIAGVVGGTVIGDPETEISGVAPIAEAGAGEITFLASPKYRKHIPGCRASAVIVREAIPEASIPQLLVANPYYAFAQVLEYLYHRPQLLPGIDGSAFVSPHATISATATVMPFAYVSSGAVIGDGSVIWPGVFIGERSVLGRDCVIHANVTVREDVSIGDRVIIHAGSVIGSDGYGYVFEKGAHYKIPQVGGVVIGDDVEIGSNVSIDRATIGNTVVGSGTKIDNLVQIAHNVRIGEKSLIVAQVGIAGSAELGSFVTLAGQVAVADHASIESGTVVGGKSGVAGEIKKGYYSGIPAIDHKTWLKAQALFARLPEMHKKMKELEERLYKLEKGIQQ